VFGNLPHAESVCLTVLWISFNSLLLNTPLYPNGFVHFQRPFSLPSPPMLPVLLYFPPSVTALEFFPICTLPMHCRLPPPPIVEPGFAMTSQVPFQGPNYSHFLFLDQPPSPFDRRSFSETSTSTCSRLLFSSP